MPDPVPRAVKRAAQTKVGNAIKLGKLIPQPCEVGVDCRGKIHAHHDDYSKPFDVRWLCHKHHTELHYATRTHCKRGHAVNEENTYYAPDGTRRCRVCNLLSFYRAKERKLVAASKFDEQPREGSDLETGVA